jgi:hypothetical protein
MMRSSMYRWVACVWLAFPCSLPSLVSAQGAVSGPVTSQKGLAQSSTAVAPAPAYPSQAESGGGFDRNLLFGAAAAFFLLIAAVAGANDHHQKTRRERAS